MVVLNPNKTLVTLIHDLGIQKVVQNICHDEQEEAEESKTVEEPDQQIDEDIQRLLADQPEDRKAFNLIKREETQLFTFRDKEVNQVYNVLLNYCSEQAV